MRVGDGIALYVQSVTYIMMVQGSGELDVYFITN